MRTLADKMKGWLTTPFETKNSPLNWGLLVIFLLCVVYLWTRVMGRISERLMD